MEKTYKFELPQSKEVESTNVRIEDGKVFVDVKFKERFQPKDGDFLVLGYKDKDGSCYWISIIKEFEKLDDITILTTDYVNYIFLADGNQSDCLNKIEFDCETSAAEEVRYATEQEKADFISRLEKEYGKRWNAETKQLEDFRWTPENVDDYWYITDDLEIAKTTFWDSNNFHVHRVISNNCFKTEEAAQKVLDQIKEIFKNSKTE